MLRVHFIPAELTGVTLAPSISDTWEMLLSARQLQSSEASRQFGDWRARVRHSGLRESVVDLLDGCLSSKRHRDHPLAPEMCLERTLDTYWQHALTPYWSALQQHVTADMQGTRPPASTIFVQTQARPVLICPVTHDPRVFAPASANSIDADLGQLIGPARVEVLPATQTPATTNDLAARLGPGVSTESRHASALAAAQLIFPWRNGRSVTHSISSLGMELLGESGRQATDSHLSFA